MVKRIIIKKHESFESILSATLVARNQRAGSGKLMQTLMTRDGKYTPAYAAALTCVSSVLGPIVPP